MILWDVSSVLWEDIRGSFFSSFTSPLFAIRILSKGFLTFEAELIIFMPLGAVDTRWRHLNMLKIFLEDFRSSPDGLSIEVHPSPETLLFSPAFFSSRIELIGHETT